MAPGPLHDREGEFVDWRYAKIHLLSHTLHFGCGAFEGVPAYETPTDTGIFRPQGARRAPLQRRQVLHLKTPSPPEQVRQAHCKVLGANGLKAVCARPLVAFGSEKLGASPKGHLVHLTVAAWFNFGEDGMSRGIRLEASYHKRRHVNSTMTHAKVVSKYPHSVPSNMQATEDGHDEALLLDASGFVSEGAGENLFIIKNGVVYTPHQSVVAINGITRNAIFSICQDLGLTLIEKRITRDEAYICDEAFFTGMAAELTPIRELGRIEIGAGSRGPITEKSPGRPLRHRRRPQPQVR